MITNPFDPENKMITRKVQEWIRAFYGLNNDIEVQVSEVGCADTSCLCAQTYIVIQTEPLKSLKIAKPLTLVRKWDIEKKV